MKKLFLTIVAALTVSLAAQADNPYKKFTEKLPFAMPEVSAPVIPDNEVKLSDFGAVGDGIALNTEAFRKAIDALSQKGGGKLVVPQGVWHTGPIVLKSNIELHLKAGAVILFAADESLYPIIETSFEWKSLLAIPGSQELKPGYWVPSAGYAQGEKGANMNVPNAQTPEEWNAIKRFLRPVMISLVKCKNVMLKGVIFQNSPAWNLHPLMCENVIIDQVLVRNPSYAQNGDALDLESCKNALIVNSRFDAGDDGICIKSGKDADGRRRGIPCENVVVDGCTVFAGHGGFVVGSEMSGGVKNIMVENCQFLGTDVGLRFKSTRGRGGIVENIYINKVSMTDIKTDAITFNMYYGGKSVAEMLEDGDNPDNTTKAPVTEETPIFRNIDIKNCVCNGAGRAMEFNGLPEMPIDGITLQNITILAKKDAVFTNCKNITKKNVNITLQK